VQITNITREPDPTKLKFTLVNPNGHTVFFLWSEAGSYKNAGFVEEGEHIIENLYPISITFVVVVSLTTHQFMILGIQEVPAYQIFDYQRPHIVGGV
jgi:hypothetical protein